MQLESNDVIAPKKTQFEQPSSAAAGCDFVFVGGEVKWTASPNWEMRCL